MKTALAGIAAIVTGILPALVGCAEKITDERDGQKYAVVSIADKLWFAENLNFETGTSSCPEGDSRNCSKYGRLYNQNEALHACPSGWRLPNKEDFESLVNAAGGMSKAGEALKSTSGWFKKGDGSDALGFNALPAGYGSQGKFDGIGGYAYFWSSTDSEDGLAYYLFLDFSSKGAALNAFDKGSARSVRCVK